MTEEKLGMTEEKLGMTEEKLGMTEEKLGRAEEQRAIAEEKAEQILCKSVIAFQEKGLTAEDIAATLGIDIATVNQILTQRRGPR
jgi:CRP-like cAMP-binding protein